MENIVEMNVEEVQFEEAEKENLLKKIGTGFRKATKATGNFIVKHIGSVVTVSVIIMGGVAYYLIKNGANEELVEIETDESIDISDTVVEDNIVEFDKAVNE